VTNGLKILVTSSVIYHLRASLLSPVANWRTQADFTHFTGLRPLLPCPAPVLSLTSVSNSLSGRERLFTGRQHSCKAEPRTSHRRHVRASVRLSGCPSVTRWHCAKKTQARITKSSTTDSARSPVLSIKIHKQIRQGSHRAG